VSSGGFGLLAIMLEGVVAKPRVRRYVSGQRG
jgi:hypothetical protein